MEYAIIIVPVIAMIAGMALSEVLFRRAIKEFGK